MKKLLNILTLLMLVILVSSCGKSYKYETVQDDPLNARIYTLDNGLKVYMSVYKDEPRIQTYVAVRVGAKNDPAETTGLAHYFEHLMFKGTSKFGTINYEQEKPLLDEIERLFELYRNTADEKERKQIYYAIDSVSQMASKFAIPNEYDKLMSAIGATGTNAYTSFDATVYMDNIPSNEVENWAKIQANRFSNPVIRLFHTELETVYEEKNMYLTRDNMKAYEALMSGLYPHHPYGTQTVLGTQEHLKNPSITNIKKYFEKYYVPNNMAICLSGDFNPDEVIRTIDKYFGSLKSKELEPLKAEQEQPIKKPIVKTVYGEESENVRLAFRFDGANSSDAMMLKLLDMVLTNGKAGLVDLNINQKQRLLGAGSYVMENVDYQALVMYARPKQGQTLEQAKNILLEQVEKLKKGEFEDWLLKAIVTDFKLHTIKNLENNGARADMFVSSFIGNTPWKKEVDELEEMAKVTKQQLVDFANNKLGKDNYVVVYKRKGEDKNIKTMEKPQITPIDVNRDAESKFLAEIQKSKVKPIEPVFVDFTRDMSIQTTRSDIPLLYKQNVENELFELYYVFEMGNNNDKELGTAVNYLKYLGTDKYTAEQLKEEFYKLGCSFNVSGSSERVYVSLSGLNENIEPAMSLFEHLLSNAKVDRSVYQNLVNDVLKNRSDSKLNHNSNFSMLRTYAIFGPISPATNILSEQQLRSMNPQKLIDKIRMLTSYKHEIMYYGPLSIENVNSLIQNVHNVPATLKDIPAEKKFVEQKTDNKVLFAHYKAPQVNMVMLSKLGKYNKEQYPIIELYNEYFGGSMNSIVFQEMREARGLAYSAWAYYSTPSRLDRSNYMIASIGTQTDKLKEARETFYSILNDMPKSDKAFDLAKDAIVSRLRTERITKTNVLWTYLSAQKLGLDYDIRKDVFEKVPTYKLSDVELFQQNNIENIPYTYCVLGDKNMVDFNYLKTLGEVKELSQKEMFGY